MNDRNLQLVQTIEDIEKVSKIIATSGLFGITKPEQAATLMLICQAEGLNPVAALRRYHLIEGRPSMRSDAMQGEFETAGGGIIWHIRTDDTVAATFFRDKNKIDDPARQRAIARFEKLWQLSAEVDTGKQSKLMLDIAKLSYDGEETMIRTLADAVAKGIATKSDGQTLKANWSTSPKQMLTAGVVRECVRLLNPALIAGIVEETEARQIADQDRAERVAMLNAPTPQDREAIQAIIDQHREEAQTASPTRKSQLLGLASELNSKLADMELDAGKSVASVEKPAPTAETKVSETTVEPPAEKKTRSPKKPEPIAAEFTESEKPWQEIVCHLGNEAGVINGKTLGELFDPKSPERNVKSIVQYLEKHVNPVIRADTDLMLGANKGYQAWKDAHANAYKAPDQLEKSKTDETPANPPAPAEPTKTAEAPAETPTAPASESDWREFVITSRNPDYDSKKLGDLPEEKIKKINEEYLSKIDWSKATIAQKKLKAMISLALNLPPAANEEPDHTRKLKAAIQKDGVNRNDFLSECKRAGWIDRGHTKIEDVTEAESNNLLSDWPTVVEQCRQLI